MEENDGKVTKGNNEDVRKDDLVDCLGVLTVQLLGDQIQSVNKQLDETSLSMASNTRDKTLFNSESEYGARIGARDTLNDLYG